jgi:chromosome segregation ATPase
LGNRKKSKADALKVEADALKVKADAAKTEEERDEVALKSVIHAFETQMSMTEKRVNLLWASTEKIIERASSLETEVCGLKVELRNREMTIDKLTRENMDLRGQVEKLLEENVKLRERLNEVEEQLRKLNEAGSHATKDGCG